MKCSTILFLIFSISFAFSANAQVETNRILAIETVPAETMPEFPGGSEELFKFINENKHYEKEKDKNKRMGIVKVSFVIEEDGNINDTIKVIQPLSEYYDKEAIRIVKAMPAWKPGTQKGIPVRVQFNLPISF